MRRCLHSFLVGVLVLAVSMDAARACWFLRRGCRASRPAWSACASPVACGAERLSCESCGCDAVVEVDACGACEPVVADDGIVVTGELVVSDVDVRVDPAGEAAPAAETPPVATPREPAGEQAAASVVVPDLQPVVDASADDVQPTSAIEEPTMKPAAEPEQPAVAEPEPASEPPAEEPVMPAAPPEPNLFEEAEQPGEPAAADAIAEPANETPRATEDGAPMPEPSGTPEPSDTVPPPADEPAPEPVNPLDAAERRSGEAARLWVDATGRHSAVGVLVDVRADGRCVIDTGTGTLEVRPADLRRRDREYAAQAADRLAARRGPAAAETAGR